MKHNLHPPACWTPLFLKDLALPAMRITLVSFTSCLKWETRKEFFLNPEACWNFLSESCPKPRNQARGTMRKLRMSSDVRECSRAQHFILSFEVVLNVYSHSWEVDTHTQVAVERYRKGEENTHPLAHLHFGDKNFITWAFTEVLHDVHWQNTGQKLNPHTPV